MNRARVKLAVAIRLGLPAMLFLLMSSLDRVNLSFAALKMNSELGITPAQYGFAAGVVFFGYLGGQYPSMLLLQRVGVRGWVACCTLLWGACATGTAFVSVAWHLYALRFILGLAEGGLAPGFVIYLARFATPSERASSIALPMLAIPFSVIIGGPLSGWLMDAGSPLGLDGWRWMLLAEALPTLVLGVAGAAYFPNQPGDAAWLSQEERADIRAHAIGSRTQDESNDWSVLSKSITWMSAFVWFALLCGGYGLIFWLPQILKQLTGMSSTAVGLLNSLPWIGNACGIYLGARLSDRSSNRFRWLVAPTFMAGAALLAATGWGHGAGALVMLVLAGLSLGATQGAFWPMPASLLPARGFAVGAVTINIFGSMSGIAIPFAIGAIQQHAPGAFWSGVLVASVLLLAGFVLTGIRSRHRLVGV